MTFKPTKPVGEKWAFFEIEDSNFLMNSGSYFVIFFGLIFYYLGKYILHKLSVRNASNPYFRKLGIFTYE